MLMHHLSLCLRCSPTRMVSLSPPQCHALVSGCQALLPTPNSSSTEEGIVGRWSSHHIASRCLRPCLPSSSPLRLPPSKDEMILDANFPDIRPDSFSITSGTCLSIYSPEGAKCSKHRNNFAKHVC